MPMDKMASKRVTILTREEITAQTHTEICMYVGLGIKTACQSMLHNIIFLLQTSHCPSVALCTALPAGGHASSAAAAQGSDSGPSLLLPGGWGWASGLHGPWQDSSACSVPASGGGHRHPAMHIVSTYTGAAYTYCL